MYKDSWTERWEKVDDGRRATTGKVDVCWIDFFPFSFCYIDGSMFAAFFSWYFLLYRLVLPQKTAARRVFFNDVRVNSPSFHCDTCAIFRYNLRSGEKTKTRKIVLSVGPIMNVKRTKNLSDSPSSSSSRSLRNTEWEGIIRRGLLPRNNIIDIVLFFLSFAHSENKRIISF